MEGAKPIVPMGATARCGINLIWLFSGLDIITRPDGHSSGQHVLYADP